MDRIPRSIALSPSPVHNARKSKRLAWIAGCVIMCVLSFANVNRALSLGMDKNPPFWVVDAIPPVLSDLQFGGAGDYTSLKAVSDTFYRSIRAESTALEHDSSMVQRAITKVLKLDPQTISRETVLLGPDDKGIVDLVKLSFSILGYSSERVLYLYFILLFGSIGVLVLSFSEDLLTLMAAGTFLAAHYLILPLVFYNPQLQSVLALRFLPVLSMIACLHCLFFIHRPQVTPARLASLFAQMALLIFAVHLRSVTLWEVALVVGFGLAKGLWIGIRPFVLSGGPRDRMLRLPFLTVGYIAIPVAVLLGGMMGLSQYRKARFNQRYLTGQQVATRVFWHNIVSGFAFNPSLSASYGFKIDDSSEAHAAGLYLTENGREEEWKTMGGMTMTEPWIWSTGFYRLNLGKYDLVAKELLISIFKRHPFQCVATFVYYKPLSLAKHLAWLYGFRRDVPDVDVFVSKVIGDAMALQLHELQSNLDARRLRFILWDPVGLFTVLAFALLLAGKSPLDAQTGWLPLVLLAVGSLIPAIVGYPGMHTIAEPTLMVAVVIYVGSAFALARLFVGAAKYVRR